MYKKYIYMFHMKKITIFVGSFKPPHKGHLYILKKMLTITNNNKNPGIVYIFISNKIKEPCNNLDAKFSKKVWKKYIQLLSEKNQKRVKLVVSALKSPTQTAYGFVNNVAKKGYVFYLVKSAKDKQNKRFDSIKTINKGAIYKEIIIEKYKTFTSKNMRKYANKHKKKLFYTYLPKKLKEYTKLQIWNETKQLCV